MPPSSCALVDDDATAEELQAALQGLPGVGDTEVVRTGAHAVGGYVWTATFLGLLGPTAPPLAPSLRTDLTNIAGAALLTGTHAAATASVTRAGIAPVMSNATLTLHENAPGSASATRRQLTRPSWWRRGRGVC